MRDGSRVQCFPQNDAVVLSHLEQRNNGDQGCVYGGSQYGSHANPGISWGRNEQCAGLTRSTNELHIIQRNPTGKSPGDQDACPQAPVGFNLLSQQKNCRALQHRAGN